MLKMMTYYEANLLPLNHTLSPNKRCIWKKQALDEGADPTPMNVSPYNTSAWTDNRLIPATIVRKNDIIITWNAVEPGTTGGSFAGGATTTTTNVAYGASIQANKPANPTKTGYTFYRWVNDTTHNPLGNETALSPTSYSATYTINTYTIKWWANTSHTGNPHSTISPVNYNTSITVPVNNPLAPTGYHFDHWVNRKTGSAWSSSDKANDSLVYSGTTIEYDPVFVLNTQYVMTWDPNGGTWADSTGNNSMFTHEDAGNTITRPSVSISKSYGWAFDGWYNTTLSRDYQNGDIANGSYTFTAKWIAAPVLRAAVTWQTDTDGGTNENHLVHGDPNNPYETNDWLYGSTPKIPLNIRFEPLYKDENGNEIGYGSQGDLNESTEPIGYCGGNPFYVDDIIWNASYAQNSTMNQQYSISLVFRTYNGSVDGGPTITQPSKGYGLAITVETAHNNDSMLWRDEIPVTYTTRVRINENGTYNTYNTVYNYNGTVYSPTINAVVYSLQTLSDHDISSEPSPGTAITGPWIH